jgi:hypothetical protein
MRQHVGMGLHAARGHRPVAVKDDEASGQKRAVVHQAQNHLRRVAAQIGQQAGGGARHLEMIVEQGHKAGGTRINLDKRGQRQQVLFIGRKLEQRRQARQAGKECFRTFGPRPRCRDDPGGNINQGASRSLLGRGVPSMAQDPGRVFPGKKMTGQMGDETVTTQNLDIVRVDEARSLLMVRGAVPGSKNGHVVVRPAVKAKMKKEA